MPRDYKKEYKNYHSKPKQKKNRAGRNKARSIMKKLRGQKAIKGKDIDHKNGNPRDNSKGNLRVIGRAANRSIKRNKNAGKA